MGLRDDKKRATRTAIADAALALFIEHGFDTVTVADVAAAAGVSPGTVFNYFAVKEDLFFDRADAVVDRLAGAVRAKAPGQSAVAAVRARFVDELRRREPTLGLSLDVAAFHRVIDASPALQARLRALGDRAEDALAAALADVTRSRAGDPTPRVAAAALSSVDRLLHKEIQRRILAGETPDAIRTGIG